MTGALVLLAVLIFVAWRIRPRKYVRKDPNGSTWVGRDGRGFHSPEDQDK